MISAISDNNPSFTSVVPVRVFIDGREAYSEKFVRPACRQLSTILAGPVKENETIKIAILKMFGAFDPEYNILYGISGYPKKFGQKNIQPSDYFSYTFDKNGHYFISGTQGEKLRELGHKIGIEQRTCKEHNVKTSFDLDVAKGKYWAAIKYFIRNKSLRLTENFDSDTGKKSGNPVTLILNMSSNKKYGLSTFKMKLESINFEKS